MIIEIIIPLLAVAAFFWVAGIKRSGKEMAVLMMIFATLVVHTANIMFIGLEGGAAEVKLLVNASFNILYIAEFFIFQQVFFMREKNIKVMALLSIVAFVLFSATQYMVESFPASSLYEAAKVLWMLEFIAMVILTQRLWFLSLQLNGKDARLSRTSALMKTTTLIVLAPFLIHLFTAVVPDNESLLSATEITLLIFKGVLFLFLLVQLNAVKKWSYNESKDADHNVKDLAF